VFDANGKVPAGIMSSIIDGCDLQALTTGQPCGEQVCSDLQLYNILFSYTIFKQFFNSLAT